MELFTAIYSGIPEHLEHFAYLFLGLEGHSTLVPFMWISSLAGIASLVILLTPKWRSNEKFLIAACILVFLSIWIDKGLGMVVTGFVPSPLGAVTDYWPTLPEFMISIGIYAIGALIITGLYKIALSVKAEQTAH